MDIAVTEEALELARKRGGVMAVDFIPPIA
jgi:hypothetical protein